MEKPTIGIGVTTYNRPELLQETLAFFELYEPSRSKYKIKFDLQDDTHDRKGVAYRKNQNLKALKDCDYIFLFDDDCYPINDEWETYFINVHKETGQHHFLFNDRKTHGFIMFTDHFVVTPNTGGVFMFLTKQCVEKIGGFNEKFGLYGFEHADYSNRAHRAGLMSHLYLTPLLTKNYITALDYDEKQKDVYGSSVTPEEKEHALKNFPLYLELKNNSQNYYMPIQWNLHT